MTTAQALKILSKAKTEEEMLAKAAEIGVSNSFLNIGSTVDLDERPAPVVKSTATQKKTKPLVLAKRSAPRRKTMRRSKAVPRKIAA